MMTVKFYKNGQLSEWSEFLVDLSSLSPEVVSSCYEGPYDITKMIEAVEHSPLTIGKYLNNAPYIKPRGWILKTNSLQKISYSTQFDNTYFEFVMEA